MSFAPGPSFLGFIRLDLSTDATVAAGTWESNEIKPPAGYIYKLNKIMLFAPDPDGSTTGTHKYLLGETTSQIRAFFLWESNTGSLIRTWSGAIECDTPTPADETAQYNIMNGVSEMYATESYPLYLNYGNSTDANQSESRTMIIYCSVFKELL